MNIYKIYVILIIGISARDADGFSNASRGTFRPVSNIRSINANQKYCGARQEGTQCCPGVDNSCTSFGCFCDEYCMTANDCCPDYYAVCQRAECFNYQWIQNEKKRSAGYLMNISVDTPFSDHDLIEGWYRINSDNGDEMPTAPPGLKNCGTYQPVWLNDSFPDVASNDINKTSCVQTINNQCEITIDIKISNCTQGFYVYYLTGTPENSAYCFGDGEVLCEEGFSSESGYYPGCSSSFPNDTFIPIVTAGLEEGDVMSNFHGFDPGPKLDPIFVCNIDEDSSDIYVYDIHWYINGDEIKVYKNILFSDIKSTYLRESDWINMHKLNMQVRCAVRVRYMPNALPSPFYYSPWFLAGVFPEKNEYFLVEGESVNITFISTVPVGCIGSAEILKKTCYHDLYIFQPNKISTGDSCINHIAQKDVVFKAEFCGIQFTTANWNQNKTLQVFGYNDGIYNIQERTTFIRLTGSYASGIWKDINTPDIKVTVLDQDATLSGRQCSSYNDPHIRTFDGRSYHYMDIGEYVLYRNERGPYWVHALFTNCGFGWKGSSCHCGIAVRSRNSLFVVRTCEKISRTKTYLLPRPLIEMRSCVDDDMLVEEGKGHQYTIILPIGTEIKFQLNTGFISGITVKPTIFDVDNTFGLCGKLSSTKDMSDDFLHRNLGVVQDDQQFALSWKIELNMVEEQLFVEEPYVLTQQTFYNVLLPDTDSQISQYCTCKDEAGPNDDITQFYTVNCNQQEITENCKAEVHAIVNFDIKAGNTESLSAFPTSCPESSLVKRSTHGASQRLRRSTADRDDVFESSPLVYDDDVNNTVSGNIDFWNGWSEDLATKFCIEKLAEKYPAEEFDKITTVSLQSYVESCVMDIKLVGDSLFLEDTVTAIQIYTTTELKRNESLFDIHTDNGTQSILDYLTSFLCYRNCSNNGICVSGECVCNDTFIGDDCSRQITEPPANVQLPFNGLCGTYARECARTNIYGEFHSEDVWCKRRHFKIKDDAKVYTSEAFTVTEAIYRNFYMVSCELRSAIGQRSILEDSPQGFDISLSNDGSNYGDTVTIIIYDDGCYTCSTTNSTCVQMDVCTSKVTDSGNITSIIVGTVIGVVFLFGIVFVIFLFKCTTKNKCRPATSKLTQSVSSLNSAGTNDTHLLFKPSLSNVTPTDTRFAWSTNGCNTENADTLGQIETYKPQHSLSKVFNKFEDDSYIRCTTPVGLFFTGKRMSLREDDLYPLSKFDDDSYIKPATPVSLSNHKQSAASIHAVNVNDSDLLLELDDDLTVNTHKIVSSCNEIPKSDMSNNDIPDMLDDFEDCSYLRLPTPVDLFCVQNPKQ